MQVDRAISMCYYHRKLQKLIYLSDRGAEFKSSRGECPLTLRRTGKGDFAEVIAVSGLQWAGLAVNNRRTAIRFWWRAVGERVFGVCRSVCLP